MAIIDIRGASVSSADPPIATNPNPDLAWKAPVRVATTGSNINIATGGLLTIDGVALAAGDRVLVKDQTDQTTNGLYNVQTGPWTRTIDAANNSQFSQGLQVIVTQGAQNADTIFGLTAVNPILLGTTDLTWSAFGVIGGGNQTVRVVTTPGALTINANDQVVEIEAAVTTITLPALKNGPVTIIDATGNFGANNCTVTVSGGAIISGMSSDHLTVNYLSRTYRQLANGNYVIQ